jgi:hypothetical protein
MVISFSNSLVPKSNISDVIGNTNNWKGTNNTNEFSDTICVIDELDEANYSRRLLPADLVLEFLYYVLLFYFIFTSMFVFVLLSCFRILCSRNILYYTEVFI